MPVVARVRRRRRGRASTAARRRHLIASRRGIGGVARGREGGAGGQVARGSCADSDADAAELACVGSSSRGRGRGRGRAGGGGLVCGVPGGGGEELRGDG
jgi:hypothetical protein